MSAAARQAGGSQPTVSKQLALRALLPAWTPAAADVSVLYAPASRVASKVRVFVDHPATSFRTNGVLRTR